MQALHCVALDHPEIGYIQGFNFIAGNLNKVMTP